MKRPSTAWWRSTAARALRPPDLALVAALSLGGAAGPAHGALSAADLGKMCSELGVGYARDSFSGNIGDAMTGEVPMTTLDGTISFDGSLQTHSTQRIIEIFIQPSAATQDLQVMKAMQDQDGDNVFEFAYTHPKPISGICADGVISCQPGTWTLCEYYKWTTGANGYVTLAPNPLTGPDGLGSCYCVNRSCGSQLSISNPAILLRDLGGGAASAFMASHPTWSITDAHVDVPTMRVWYMGADSATTRTGGVRDDPQIKTLANYYRDPNALTGAGEDARVAALADPDSLLSQVQNMGALSSGSFEYKTCAVTRAFDIVTIDLDDILQASGDVTLVPGFLGADTFVDLTLGDNALHGNGTCNTDEATVWMLRPEYLSRVSLDTVFVDDSALLRVGSDVVWGQPHPTLTWEQLCPQCGQDHGNQTYSPALDLTPRFQTLGPVVLSLRNHVEGSGEAWATLRFHYRTECIETEGIDDACQEIRADPACELFSEQVDGVQTVQSAIGTGLVPLPSARNLGAGVCFQEYTRNWWRKDRTYLCRGAGTFDVSGIVDRAGVINDSLAAQDRTGTTNFQYNDVRYDPETGAWVIVPNLNIDLNALADGEFVPPCRKACKTTRTDPNTQVSETGPRTTQTTGAAPDFRSYLYHECNGPDGATCPMGAGETLVTDCQCLEEFAETTAVLQVLDAAQKDIICSSGARR